MSKKKQDTAKLDMWQTRLQQADYGFDSEVQKMDHREELYAGTHDITKPNCNYDRNKVSHVRNIIFENIESSVSSQIPMPKVRAMRAKDEHLAEIIEHWLRNELDRMKFESMNDMSERTVPIQGGQGWLISWDNTKRTHNTVGALEIRTIHPKQFAPQPAVYTGISDMDWFIVKVPTTKGQIKRAYHVDVYSESESEPEIRTADDSGINNYEDGVTQYVGYELNESGHINRFSWVNDVILEDLEDYQARHQPVCKKCGRVKPLPGQVLSLEPKTRTGNLMPNPETGFAGGFISREQMEQDAAGQGIANILAQRGEVPEGEILSGITYEADEKPQKYDGGACPFCGSEEFTSETEEYEQIMVPITTANGVNIPGPTAAMNELGEPIMKPTLIPFYKPDMYPIILQKNVSVYGQLLGGSDVDVIEDQQNTVNILEQKIIDRLLEAGTRVTLPDRADFHLNSKDHEIWYIANAADKNLIGTYDFTGNLEYELAYLAQVYEEARQILGITDAFQGRRDTTAVSGKAKEIAAAQSAGRLESKRVMKDAAYQEMFELMFKFQLAYSDEPRRVYYRDEKGKTIYEEFNRYDFIEQDENGNYYWNDEFLFSVDSSTPLAANREKMWEETRNNLTSGAFGDPKQIPTLILFWTKMEELHYPGAAQTKQFLEEQLKQQQEMQMQQQQMLLQQQLTAQQGTPGNMMA